VIHVYPYIQHILLPIFDLLKLKRRFIMQGRYTGNNLILLSED